MCRLRHTLVMRSKDKDFAGRSLRRQRGASKRVAGKPCDGMNETNTAPITFDRGRVFLRNRGSAWTAAVGVILHVANVDELTAWAQQLNTVEFHVNQVGILARFPTVPQPQLDLDAVLRGAGHDP